MSLNGPSKRVRKRTSFVRCRVSTTFRVAPFTDPAPTILITIYPFLTLFTMHLEQAGIFATNWGVSAHFGSVDM